MPEVHIKLDYLHAVLLDHLLKTKKQYTNLKKHETNFQHDIAYGDLKRFT